MPRNGREANGRAMWEALSDETKSAPLLIVGAVWDWAEAWARHDAKSKASPSFR